MERQKRGSYNSVKSRLWQERFVESSGNTEQRPQKPSARAKIGLLEEVAFKLRHEGWEVSRVHRVKAKGRQGAIYLKGQCSQCMGMSEGPRKVHRAWERGGSPGRGDGRGRYSHVMDLGFIFWWQWRNSQTVLSGGETQSNVLWKDHCSGCYGETGLKGSARGDRKISWEMNSVIQVREDVGLDQGGGWRWR